MASKPPPSGAPAGVPPSGNGKYIFGAVVLIGAIGGLVAYKQCQEPPPPIVINEVVDAAPPPPRPTGRDLDDEVPPPPPVEDAAVAVDAGPRKVVGTAVGNMCDAKTCSGSASDDLSQALAFRAKQAHRCYDEELKLDATLRGKMSIAVRVGANGQVCSASVASNDMGPSGVKVGSCVVNHFRGQSLPAPRGGCIDANVPINFVPR